MSYTFTISGRSSVLSTRIYPLIILNKSDYVLGLIDFVSYNSIPNVDNSNNIFHYGNCEVVITEGSYEVKDIEKYILNHIIDKEDEDATILTLKANNNTFKCGIKCNKSIDFTKKK